MLHTTQKYVSNSFSFLLTFFLRIMTKNSIVFPDNDQYGFTQLTEDNNTLSSHKYTQQQQSLSTINNIQNVIKTIILYKELM